MSIKLPGFRLGIIGGGQLGRMMAIEARRLGIKTVALDPADKPPIHGIADVTMQGDLYDPSALQRLALQCDVITYEIEHINTRALAELEAEGARLVPRPGLLETIQDKYVQKQFLSGKGLPTPIFQRLPAGQVETYHAKNFPFVQKARSGGYDGRGVVIINNEKELGRMLKTDSMIEEYITVRQELSVLLARNADGNVEIYPIIEMIFDSDSQICDSVCAPARIPEGVATRCRDISRAAIDSLDGVGVFAVELFWAADGRILINEIAPRPHNSGHWTIEGAVTNQFEQHIRAVSGLPLGSAALVRPSVTVNLLGAPDASGSPLLMGAAAALAIQGLKLHWYQKETVSPSRKMGHFTVTHTDLDEALRLAARAQATLSVQGSATS